MIVIMNVVADICAPITSVVFYGSPRGSHRLPMASKPRRI
jgi:hypothetical protein